MLDGFHRTVVVGKPGCVLNAAEVGDGGGNFEVAQVRAAKTDAVIRRSGLQAERNFLA